MMLPFLLGIQSYLYIIPFYSCIMHIVYLWKDLICHLLVSVFILVNCAHITYWSLNIKPNYLAFSSLPIPTPLPLSAMWVPPWNFISKFFNWSIELCLLMFWGHRYRCNRHCSNFATDILQFWLIFSKYLPLCATYGTAR